MTKSSVVKRPNTCVLLFFIYFMRNSWHENKTLNPWTLSLRNPIISVLLFFLDLKWLKSRQRLNHICCACVLMLSLSSPHPRKYLRESIQYRCYFLNNNFERSIYNFWHVFFCWSRTVEKLWELWENYEWNFYLLFPSNLWWLWYCRACSYGIDVRTFDVSIHNSMKISWEAL